VIRWGIIGTGLIASTFAADLELTGSGTAVAVGSRREGSADAFGDRFGIPNRHVGYEALVADPEVDVVYVATPHHLHLPHALLAVAAGKHVLVEKPVGLDAAEAQQIGDAAAEAGVLCMEAMWTLFLPRYDVVRRLLADGVIGDPRAVVADMGERFDEGHRILRADLAGGPMLDLGTYPVTLATWVLGAPEQVAAVGSPAANGINGQLAMALTTASGAAASLFISIVGDTPTAACISGDLGRIELGGPFYRPGPVRVVLRDGVDLTWDEPRVAHAGLHFEAAEVARRVTAGETGSPLRPWADTLATLDVMDRLRAEAGVDFPEARAARDAAGADA
jgi:predicted dehydrogenase